ncbi:solute carrier family 35 (UDP-galactose transporter), member B1 [Kwoniella heveanensis BCC8398]|uniref:UDP-galactose transporter homolog 1 n=1 Tax=Kwoniella heveanensis BCC8398 TaxID=1296120 RepID=A0A1B9GPT8_9TREE|nr:solute carrier family 35 (UDP-galactose transporter), member B1 [Kwoniella heveanensis BCC8398]
MGVIRLAVCVSGVYAAFLLWAIAQERLSAPFLSTSPHPHSAPKEDSSKGDKFPSPLFLNYAQAVASSLSALSYLLSNAWRDGTLNRGIWEISGLSRIWPAKVTPGEKVNRERVKKDEKVANGKVELKRSEERLQNPTSAPAPTEWRKSLPALLLQVSLFQTIASPIGFLALRHISYPTMSCKLIPVLLLNVLLYRRRFSPHKYVVVALVTVGISLFMLLAEGGKKKKGGSDSAWGLWLLVVNLLIDGLTNSTQDQIFSTYRSFTGQQMMFCMSLFTQLLLLPALLLPLPNHPLSLLSHLPAPLSSSVATSPLTFSPPVILTSISFIYSHPTAFAPLLAYALLGGLGQLFIFETIQHFGSLTLVMVTVTRKLFTMLLSVVVFEHKLTKGQWMGVAVVFGGIGVEAGMKRREMLRRAKKDK